MIAGVLVLSLSNLWFVSRAYQHGVFSVQVRMYINMRLIGSQGISVATVIGFVAAADTSSSFFYRLWRYFYNYAIPTASPLYHSLYLSFMVPSTRSSCLNYAGSHLCSHIGNCGSLKILFHIRSFKAC